MRRLVSHNENSILQIYFPVFSLHPRAVKAGASVGYSDDTACQADDPRLGDLQRAHASYLKGEREAKSFERFANPMDLVDSFKLVENRQLEKRFLEAKERFGTGTEQVQK